MGRSEKRCECVEIENCKIDCRYWHGLWVISLIRFTGKIAVQIPITFEKIVDTFDRKTKVQVWKENSSYRTFKIIFAWHIESLGTINCRHSIREINRCIHYNPGNQSRNIGKARFKADNLIISSSLIFSAKLDQLSLVAKRSSLVVLCVRQSRFPAAPWNWILVQLRFSTREIATITFCHSLYCNSADRGFGFSNVPLCALFRIRWRILNSVAYTNGLTQYI